jgi:beta-lactamase regulating signal transducer with metallopeptidase domain
MLLGGLTWFMTGFVFRKKRRSNTTVHLLWLLSLLSLPILFGLNQFVPALSIGGNPVPELVQAAPVNVSGLPVLTTDLPEISSTRSDTQPENPLLAGSKSFVNWETKTDLLLYVWAIGAFTMLVRFMFGLYRIYQLRHSAVAADDTYQSICQRLARQLNINRPVTVCFSDRVVSPISFGWLAPYILIPRTLNLEQFELVAAHELAHVQRLNWLTNLFSHLVGVIFFFHPIYHFLNRELVRLRERICDDWVIRLTGARKNYAQCLLDLVRHKEQTVPLALSLNQPSQLESRIDSILKNNRQLDVQLKPRLRLIAATLLLTCLPLLAMAQLIPLKTFQVSLFAQTPQKSEKGVDKTEKKQRMEKAKVGKMDGKQYKDESHIKVKDPTLLEQSEENRIFSGPQPSEKLPPLTVTGIGGRIDGTTFDITTKADGKPLILFLQDTNAVGVKGLVNVSRLLLKIDALQKRYSKATGAETSNQGLQIGVVFLADNLDTLPEWAHNMLKKEIPNEVLTGLSPDGREGPGSYGLNRNVAQTPVLAYAG